MRIELDCSRLADYRTFLAVKRLPRYRFVGRVAEFPDEYADRIGLAPPPVHDDGCSLIPRLFDYQKAVTELAIRKRKFAVFMECGLGKTLVFTEFARHAIEQLPAGSRVLIVSPLMVIPQTIAEGQRFYGDSLVITRIEARNLKEWLSTGTGIGITNYDALSSDLPDGTLGGLILDECFAPGTLVDTFEFPDKIVRKHIENILPCDRIINAQGVDTVTSVRRREVPYAVHVKVGEGITCSPNHPFFTRRGWVGAQDLEPGDSISLSSTAMRIVRSSVYPEGCGARTGEILRSILLSEMEDEPTGAQGEGSHGGHPCENRASAGAMASIGRTEGRSGDCEDHGIESNVRSGCSPQSVPDIDSHEPRTFRAWGEWSGIDEAAEALDGCSWKRLDGGICVVAGPTHSRISHALQARLGESQAQSRHRGGWSLPLVPQGSGQEEGCQAGFARVEGLEILEPGDPRLDRLRDADGKLYFYDLEAERHPSFSVNGLLVHNSSMLKSHYGKWGHECIRLGKGVPWKLALTGTPAPNDRIEYANHAVFLDQYPTINSFLARFFVNRGQTDNRWELKAHALDPFYRALSHWSIFLSNPATYGWKDNSTSIPPIHVHIHEVGMTQEQEGLAYTDRGTLFAMSPGGITSRSVLSQIAKGHHKGKDIESLKPAFIRSLVDSWPDESTIIWCHYNHEQESIADYFPDAANIDGSTPIATRQTLIDDFKSGRRKVLISKPRILGFGLNLQVATRQVFSGLQDSYEEYHQAVKRSNRVGSTRPLNVHIPVTEIERPMIETVLRKAAMVQSDTEEQERIFFSAR